MKSNSFTLRNCVGVVEFTRVVLDDSGIQLGSSLREYRALGHLSRIFDNAEEGGEDFLWNVNVIHAK